MAVLVLGRENSAMIIGIDIDNTITHTTEMIMHYARIFGEEQGINTTPDPHYYYLEDTLGWNQAEAHEFLSQYLGRIYREMRPKDGAVEVIRELKKQHQIILITSRNRRFPQIEEITAAWLAKNGLIYDRLILNTTGNMHHFSKLSACRENRVELMIEDHHELVEEISPFIPVMMFDYPYNRHLSSENIIRVNNWKQVHAWVANRQWGKVP